MQNRMKEYLNTMIENEYRKGCFVGANARVYQHGECLYQASIGYADREKETPMQADSIFRIYSLTKPVTAVAIAQLVERGLLHTDTPLHWYIPEFQNASVITEDGGTRTAKCEILIRDLLNMTSGLPYANCCNASQKRVAEIFGQMESDRLSGKGWTALRFAKKMGEVPLMFDPGTKWEYGISADILGAVIESITGKSLREYFCENIFDPLGMVDTDFYVPESKHARFTAAYQWVDNALQPDNGLYFGLNGYLDNPTFYSGGAGLVSTIDDYAKFMQMLANGGVTHEGNRILSSRSIRDISTPQIHAELLDPANWDSLRGYDYGSLVRVLRDPIQAGTLANIGEFGWDGWTGAYACTDPSEGLSILFWIQIACAGTSHTAKLMRNIVYANL